MIDIQFIRATLGVLCALPFAILTACADPDAPTVSASDYYPNWTQLPDGSLFAKLPRSDPQDVAAMAAAAAIEAVDEDGTTIGIRCWDEGAGNQQFCLSALKTGNISPLLSIHVSSPSELPTVVLPHGTPDGYSCSAMMGSITEEISRGDRLLISNRIGYGSPPWTGNYVRRFMRDNDVEGQWFDCDRLIRIIHAGSLETMTTTVITRSMLPSR